MKSHRSPPKFGQFSLVLLLYHLCWRKESATFSPFRQLELPGVGCSARGPSCPCSCSTPLQTKCFLGRHHYLVAPAIWFCLQEQQHLCLCARILLENSERFQLNLSVELREKRWQHETTAHGKGSHWHHHTTAPRKSSESTESATQGDTTEASKVENKSLLVQLQKDIKQDLPLFLSFSKFYK